MPRKYTIDAVRAFVSENSKSTLLSTEYRNGAEKLLFRCSCGKEFETDFAHFKNQNQRACTTCSRKRRADSRRLTLDTINSRLMDIGCEYVSGEYANRRSNITIKCSCGHLKNARLNTVLTGSFSGLCSECSSEQFHGQNRLNLDLVAELCASRGLELRSKIYKNARTPLLVRCSCGREFTTTWNSIQSMDKTRCDKCTGRMSQGEYKIESRLKEHGIQYERQKQFQHCGGGVKAYRFDFYIPAKNMCIEFDGQQHFKEVDFSGKADAEALRETLFDTQCRDLVKDMYCQNHGIQLLRIRYDEEHRISDILDSKLIPR